MAPVDATSPVRLENRNKLTSSDSLQGDLSLHALVKASEAQASLILEEARREAAQIKEEATREAESLRQEATRSGYQEGRQAGYQKAIADAGGVTEEARKVFEETLRRRQEIFDSLHEEFIAVAVAMAEKIIRQEVSLEPGVIINICRAVVKKALDSTTYSLSVYPELSPVVEAHRHLIEQHLPKDAAMQVVPDADIELGDCCLETDTSVVHGEVKKQLAVLSKALNAEEEENEDLGGSSPIQPPLKRD